MCLGGFHYIVITGNSRIVIGENVTLNSAMRSNIAGINHPVILAAVGDNASIVISDDCGLFGAIVVAVEEVFLEKGVMLGANVVVSEIDLHPVNWELHKKQLSIFDAKHEKIRIGEGTLIGMSSVILKGASIGQKSFVGACSVVTHPMKGNKLIAGNPAREIKNLD
jgi:acetyltransferase-like isoleucine patch superfamily enzyme